MEVPGIKVKLKKHFSVVRETLDRMGTINKDEKILNPSCYLLHKQGEYYIIHFKNLLLMDGLETEYSEDDNIRQTSIAQLLEDWGLVEIVNEEQLTEECVFIFVLPHSKKYEYRIIHKYKIGSLNNIKKNK